MDILKMYEIPVSWRMCGTVRVRAKNLEDATRIVESGIMAPKNGRLDGGYRVDFSRLNSLNLLA